MEAQSLPESRRMCKDVYHSQKVYKSLDPGTIFAQEDKTSRPILSSDFFSPAIAYNQKINIRKILTDLRTASTQKRVSFILHESCDRTHNDRFGRNAVCLTDNHAAPLKGAFVVSS